MASFRRKLAFESFIHRVVSKLKDYIIQANKENKNGWQDKARSILSTWDTEDKKPNSFLMAYQFIENFCAQELVDTGHWLASYFVSEKTLEEYGLGSELKKSLEAILSKTNPYSVVYLYDEIEEGQRMELKAKYPFNPRELKTISTSYVPFYSRESRRVLDAALSDEQLCLGLAAETREYYPYKDFKKVITDYQENKDKDISSLQIVL